MGLIALSWRFPGDGSSNPLQDWATSLSCIGEGNGNPLQRSCLENPRDGGAWWAAVYGVAQSRTRLKRLSSSNADSTHGHHQMVNTKIRLIIFFAAKNGEVLYSQKIKTGSWLWSDHELLIAKFRLKWKKVGKTNKPFRYDVNQIPYNYTVEVTNRFKGLDLIDRVLKNYRWRFMTLYRRQGSRPSPRKRNAKR